MKNFINFIKKQNQNKKLLFLKWVLIFYVLIMAIYLFLMLANLSSAPQFIYSQF